MKKSVKEISWGQGRFSLPATTFSDFWTRLGVKVLQAFAPLTPTTAYAAVPPLSSAGA